MLSEDQVREVIGAGAYDSEGNQIGTVDQVFLDDETGEPVFATVNRGVTGGSETFLPLANASASQGRLDVGFDQGRIAGAPNINAEGGHLSPQEEQVLYEYYGIPYLHGDDWTAQQGVATVDADEAPAQPAQASSSDDAMTRSEEKLQVGTRSEVTGRVRLRKYVVTENVTMTVPVRKEKVVVERVPDGEEDATDTGESIGGAPVPGDSPDVVLYEEVPVVATTVRPVERVRLGTEEVTEMETVTEEVRQERIAVEGDVVERGDDARADS
jgi:uncharacterized protein (TIGR02271 family)